MNGRSLQIYFKVCKTMKIWILLSPQGEKYNTFYQKYNDYNMAIHKIHASLILHY